MTKRNPIAFSDLSFRTPHSAFSATVLRAGKVLFCPGQERRHKTTEYLLQ
jgi:hypothetical protein